MSNAADHLPECYESTPPRKSGERTVYLYNAWRGVRGDMDGDGVVGAFDVDDFEDAIADFASYQASYPDLDGHARGDVNGDGVVDSFDEAAFSALLSAGGDKLDVSRPAARTARQRWVSRTQPTLLPESPWMQGQE